MSSEQGDAPHSPETDDDNRDLSEARSDPGVIETCSETDTERQITFSKLSRGARHTVNRESQFGKNQQFHALNFQHEQFAYAAREDRATSEERSNSQSYGPNGRSNGCTTSNIENTCEADINDRQRLCNSEICCESTQALEAQRGAPVRETAR